jgi:hypothetical protein
MKIYKTQSEVEKDIKDGILEIIGDVKFECSISINANIKVVAGNINALEINAWNITAWNITARDINARDINAWDINAWNITARDINAGNITARDINAGNINAWEINAGNILYYAFCCVYNGIKCLSIKSKRTPAHQPICLDGKLQIIEKEKVETIEIGGIKYSKQEVEEKLKDIKAVE